MNPAEPSSPNPNKRRRLINSLTTRNTRSGSSLWRRRVRQCVSTV